MSNTIEKVSIIISKGSLEGVYPALIMANGARMEGIEVNVFFTFFGMEAINIKHYEHLKVATVGNPGLHIPTMLGGLPGMSSFVTHQMEKKIAALKKEERAKAEEVLTPAQKARLKELLSGPKETSPPKDKAPPKEKSDVKDK